MRNHVNSSSLFLFFLIPLMSSSRAPLALGLRGVEVEGLGGVGGASSSSHVRKIPKDGQQSPERPLCCIQICSSPPSPRASPSCHLADSGHFCLGERLCAAPNKAADAALRLPRAAQAAREIHHRDVDEKIYGSVI